MVHFKVYLINVLFHFIYFLPFMYVLLSIICIFSIYYLCQGKKYRLFFFTYVFIYSKTFLYNKLPLRRNFPYNLKFQQSRLKLVVKLQPLYNRKLFITVLLYSAFIYLKKKKITKTCIKEIFSMAATFLILYLSQIFNLSWYLI